ncbi:MAG: hypothetical protein C4K58_06315 [Flavobacteriaceae bacterium]|nr:MAG: hypothetical protein C4K58_06315 [Flavobacteriaceae bacterium]
MLETIYYLLIALKGLVFLFLFYNVVYFAWNVTNGVYQPNYALVLFGLLFFGYTIDLILNKLLPIEKLMIHTHRNFFTHLTDFITYFGF